VTTDDALSDAGRATAAFENGHADSRTALDNVFRAEYPRLVAGLARMVDDVGIAEDLAQDAVVAALEQWPVSGVPQNCGAWLMTIGKRRGVDRFRRNDNLQRKYAEIGRDLQSDERAVPYDPDTALDEQLGDDLLRLVFTTCHPVLAVPARVALTLRLLGGLTTQEIARAYLVPEPTIAQRIVRAKKTLTNNRVPFEVPRGTAFLERLPSVLEVIYLIFNEGYSATASDDWMRPALCEDALRLGRTLIGLVPKESEALGLVALMEIQASRTAARTGPSGEPTLLLDQDRTRWDHAAIERGLQILVRAQSLGRSPGPYLLQAAIAACHARASRPQDTDWAGIAGLYSTLAAVMPSPVVELNRAVAVGMAYGANAGLALADQLTQLSSLRNYHLLPSIRGDFLYKLGRFDEARAEFERAADLTANARERELSLARARACVVD
jgi:RNA polymerase sigma-70 factor, ECF subfamily